MKKTRKHTSTSLVKPTITKTKKAAIPAANGHSIACAIAKNETEKAAAIAKASWLMKVL